MFLIFGMGKQTVKKLGKTQERMCERCDKRSRLVLVKIVDWFTVFFIPVFPYMTRYAFICPLCDSAIEVDKDDLNDITRELSPVDSDDNIDHEISGSLDSYNNIPAKPVSRYQGKNPTQIAYLSKLEARERELEAQREREERESGTKHDIPDRETVPKSIDQPKEPQGKLEPVAENELGARRVIRETAYEAKLYALQAREVSLEAREKAVEAREKALMAREKACEIREMDFQYQEHKGDA